MYNKRIDFASPFPFLPPAPHSHSPFPISPVFSITNMRENIFAHLDFQVLLW